MRHWYLDYIGLPFKLDGRDRSGVDCYGLVCLVYKEKLDIELNPFSGIFTNNDPKTLLKISEIMVSDRDNWDSADEIQEYDMIQLRTGRHAFHVGLAINKTTMIHIEHGIDCVIERLDGPVWKNRIDWVFRHRLLNK